MTNPQRLIEELNRRAEMPKDVPDRAFLVGIRYLMRESADALTEALATIERVREWRDSLTNGEDEWAREELSAALSDAPVSDAALSQREAASKLRTMAQSNSGVVADAARPAPSVEEYRSGYESWREFGQRADRALLDIWHMAEPSDTAHMTYGDDPARVVEAVRAALAAANATIEQAHEECTKGLFTQARLRLARALPNAPMSDTARPAWAERYDREVAENHDREMRNQAGDLEQADNPHLSDTARPPLSSLLLHRPLFIPFRPKKSEQ